MSLRLHFLKTYKVEYSSDSFGNYKSYEFEHLMYQLIDTLNGDKNGVWFSEESNEFEILKPLLEKLIIKLTSLSSTEYEKFNLEESKESLILFLQKALNESESSEEYVRFTWF